MYRIALYIINPSSSPCEEGLWKGAAGGPEPNTASMSAARLCDSTTRQQRPPSGRASDNSATGVEVVDDMYKVVDGLDTLDGLGAQRGVVIFEPRGCDRVVAADDGGQGDRTFAIVFS
jgi:hypothetical protein